MWVHATAYSTTAIKTQNIALMNSVLKNHHVYTTVTISWVLGTVQGIMLNFLTLYNLFLIGNLWGRYCYHILQMRKLKLRVIKQLVQGHSVKLRVSNLAPGTGFAHVSIFLKPHEATFAGILEILLHWCLVQ